MSDLLPPIVVRKKKSPVSGSRVMHLIIFCQGPSEGSEDGVEKFQAVHGI